MEILIPGLLLVALMVYASTKIKENAAAAYEKETIETADLSITKPEGLIIPTESAHGIVFEAYSRDFGIEEAGDVRQMTAVVRRHEATNIDEVRKAVEAEDETVEVNAGKMGAHTTYQIRYLRYERNAEVRETVKLIESERSVLELRISALTMNEDINEGKVATMVETFRAN